MNTSPNKPDDTPTPPDKSTVVFLLGTMADTTWRMFVPIVGLAIAGVTLDIKLHTKPWLTITGIVLGVAIAGVLVVNQIKKVKK